MALEIVKKQSEIYAQIIQLESNVKKDGPSRINTKYVMQKLATLDGLWQEFAKNHDEITKGGSTEGEYFEKDIYRKMQDKYIEFKNYLMHSTPETSEMMELPSLAKAGKLPENMENKIAELLNEQRTNVKAFERQVKKLNIEEFTAKWQLEDELKNLTSRWESIDRLYWKLDNLQNMDKYEADYDRLEQVYKAAKEQINKKIMSDNHKERTAPKLDLPIFNGHYESWVTFKDLFVETIHQNPFIPTAQKMQHLKAKLRGEAEKLVQHLTISADNYETCWDILTHRYDNARLLFTHYATTMLNQPNIQRANAAQIKKMHDTTLECLHAITNLGIDVTSWDPLIVHILVQKLDPETTEQYIESMKSPRELPVLDQFLEYLELKFMALESSSKATRNAGPSTANNMKLQPYHNNQANYNKQFKPTYFGNRRMGPAERPVAFHRTLHATKWTCPKCKKDHGLYMCGDFLRMTPEIRLKTVEQLNVCKNCLYNHHGQECKPGNRCRICGRAHSTYLHDALTKTMQSAGKPADKRSSYVSNDEHADVILATIQLKVQAADGTFITFKALLDQGSQLTLITENAVQQLNLKRNKYDAVISGLGAQALNKCKGGVIITCQSIHGSNMFNTKALIMNKLTNKLPTREINIDNWDDFTTLKLADPQFNIPGEIDILLGADVYSEIIMEGLIKGHNNRLTAQQTQLGWVICGTVATLNCHVIINNTEDMSRFWEQEELADEQKAQDPDNECEALYQESTIRLEDGRYQVRLPMKPGFEKDLGASKHRAVAVLNHLERKMSKNSRLAEDYKQFIKEYRDLGHMRWSNVEHALQFYLPHHEVIREEAVTTKLRVVFNASAKSTSGLSLNDLMESGPNLQADLQSLLLKWRQYRYAFTADLEKMFRFIAIDPRDQPLQKIVWRDELDQPITSYQLCTVTYGTKAAPYLAQRTLKQLAVDEGDKYPVAKEILEKQFYMDDVLFGSNTIAEGKATRDDLIKLLRCGGFNLRKWSSSKKELVEDLPADMRNPHNFSFTDTENLKTLGLGWNPKKDEFTFSSTLNKQETDKYTKRKLLSEIAMIFDPLGWLAPVTIKAKILFQQIWTLNATWDEELPESIKKEWLLIKEDLGNISQLKVPRWLGFDNSNVKVELHVFSDAAEKAFSTVIFCTIRKETGSQTHLIAAKTKVAPMRKKITLPRLELCGAVLAAKLTNKILNTYSNIAFQVYAWTDSMVVLGWLNGKEQRWNVFVANRVREIKAIIKPEHWNYVKSAQNPADCATRGMLPSQLAQFDLWWKGPEWLSSKEQLKQKLDSPKFTTQEEVKQTLTVQDSSVKSGVITDLLENCNSATKAVRVLAWVLRFITKARGDKADSVHLTLKELQRSHNTIVSYVQQECYESEIRRIKAKGFVDNKSSIFKLNPRLDKQGILRVGGRLSNSALPDGTKFPIILPKKHRLTYLLIQRAHIATLHGGARLTQGYLRQRYWIPGGNSRVKQQLRNCVKCVRFTPNKPHQKMGDLPGVRVTPSRPFSNCGVDYAGPVEVRLNKGRGVRVSKGYIAVFVCMATKAVHLELVSDLTSQTFIAALKRMAARRGVPKNIYSDNGSNFLGASRELKRQFKENLTFTSGAFHDLATSMGIEWHFNAPSWPTGGGLWEAAVKSMKYHLKRVLGEQKLTFEEFATLLAQVEACLNSRPLCALSEEFEDQECVLTPGHFLIGQPLTTLPQEDLSEEKSLLKRWQLTKKLYQDFWKGWSRDYISELQVRGKWNKNTSNLEKGNIVIIKEDNIAPSQWALARIEEVHPGKDSLVRVVTVKTQRGKLKRPVTKLIKLPIEEQPAEQRKAADKESRRSSKVFASLWHCVYIMLTLMSIIAGGLAQSVRVSEFEKERQVFYDDMGTLQNIHESWKILTFFNMTTYWRGVNKMDDYVAYIDGLCKKFEYQRVCEGIVTELQQEIEDIKHNNFILQSQQALKLRFRRGLINGVGQIANSLFGVLDERFAEQYEKDIAKVKQNEDYLLNLLKNQTSIVESQNNMIQRNEVSMNKQLRLMEQHMADADMSIASTRTKVHVEMLMTYFNAVALAANMIIMKLRRTQESVVNTLNNIHKGYIDSSILSQEQMLQQLSLIASRLPRHLSLPVEDIHNELMDIYKILHVKARITAGYLIMEVSLPLIQDVQFQLYKIIPLPIITKGRSVTIQASFEYAAVNIIKDLYIGINQQDLQLCMTLQDTKYLCTFNRPVHSMRQANLPCELGFVVDGGNGRSNVCRRRAETCTNRWIGLHRRNAWIYVCCEECQLRIICNEVVTSRSVQGTGIINAGQGCTIKREETIIQTDTVYQSRLFVSQRESGLSFNDLNNMTKFSPLKHLHIATEDHGQAIADIQDRIQELKNNSELPNDITEHDVHQYAVSYFCLIVIGGIIAVGSGAYYSWRRRMETAIDATQGPEPKARAVPGAAESSRSGAQEIEMSVLSTSGQGIGVPANKPLFNV